MKEKGFSLVELAIVLVIIGLIVGGILTGQDLIRGSELNRVVADINKYQTAMQTFRLKYNNLPGDIDNASSYWSGTANGNKDAVICCAGSSASNEQYLFWYHLGLSGILSGGYDNNGAWTNNPQISEEVAPVASGGNHGVMPVHAGSWTNWGWATTGLYGRTGNAFKIGLVEASTFTRAGVINAEEMYSIDAKHDDGLPATGKIFGIRGRNAANNGFETGCVSANPTVTVTTATYSLSDTTTSCTPIFWFNN